MLINTILFTIEKLKYFIVKNNIILSLFFGALFLQISFPTQANPTVPGNNTGPAKVVDCAGLGTGSKKICMSENINPCTESDYF